MNASPDTHSKVIGYLLWLFGFTGSHRFYYGKPVSGTIWFFTLGLLLIGWIVDLFLIPSMDRAADRRFVAGPVSYSVAWNRPDTAGHRSSNHLCYGRIPRKQYKACSVRRYSRSRSSAGVA